MSVRRDIRLRKEFLNRKQQLQAELTIADKKRKLNRALEAREAIPTEMVIDFMLMRWHIHHVE
jgi:hypothetical protein